MAEIKNHGGIPTLFIDGKPYPTSIMMVRTRKKANNTSEEIFPDCEHADYPDGSGIYFDKEHFKKLGESGIKIFMISSGTTWLSENPFEHFDAEAKMLLEAIPDAYIIARFGMNPSVEWVKENLGEAFVYSDGKSPALKLFTESYEGDYPVWFSLISNKWRQKAGEELAKTWRLMMKLPYADRIISAFIAAGHTSEWKVPQFYNDETKAVLDISEPFRFEYSEFLKEKYGSEERLRELWNDPTASFEHPKIPEYEAHYFEKKLDYDVNYSQTALANCDVPEPPRSEYHIGSFVNLNKHPHVLDFYHTYHYGIARSQIHFAKVIKEITPDRLVGFNYGTQAIKSPASLGKCAATLKLIDSPYVDYLEIPSVYENRRVGGSVGQRLVNDSIALHGKLFVCQDDVRTLAENRFNQSRYYVFDMEDSINVLKREFGKVIAEEMQSWWFDQLISGRRYKYPEIYELFSRQHEILEEAYSLDRKKKAEIAFIFDEESLLTTSYQTNSELIEMLRNYELPKIGAPYTQYYHNDMLNPDMPEHKLYIFVNCFTLTDEECEVIKAKLRREQAVAVFVYAAGFINPEAKLKMSAENMERITGMKMAMEDHSFDAIFRWDGEEHPMTAKTDRFELHGELDVKRDRGTLGEGEMPLSHIFAKPYLYPLFYSVDDDAVDLARFCSSGYPAVSIKETDGYTSVYYGAKILNHKDIRSMAKYAGVHIFSEGEDVVYAGRNYITVHASSSGNKTLKFKKTVRITEAYENKVYGEGVCEASFDMHFGETKTFRIEEI